MKTATDMLDFVRGNFRTPYAAGPIITSAFTQEMHRHDWLCPSHEPRTIEHICAVGQACGFVPFFEVMGIDVGVLDCDEVFEEIRRDTLDRVKRFRTPHGEFTFVRRLTRYQSSRMVRHAFTTLRDLDACEYILRRSLDRIERCRAPLKEVVTRAGERAVPGFRARSALTCFDLIGPAERVRLLREAPARMRRLCELSEALSSAAAKVAAEAGFTLFLAGTESSLHSPATVQEYILPFLLQRRQWVRKIGGIFCLQERGPMRRLLEEGVYQRLSPDILEGFQPPPDGDIADLGDAARRLPESVVTRGNLDLEFLLAAKPEEVRDAGLNLLMGLHGRRHILGGSCSARPGTPLDNLRALTQAAEVANRAYRRR